jgi:molybdenum cofactor biosynthesis protein B
MTANQDPVGIALIGVGAMHGQDSGQLARQTLEAQGHQIIHSIHIKDASLQIKGELALLSQNSSCQAILIHGGTELSLRTSAYDTAERLLEKRLEGFGQILRQLCFQEYGSKAVHVRAAAGLCKGRLLMIVPSDVPTLKLALDQLIGPELNTLAKQLKRL